MENNSANTMDNAIFIIGLIKMGSVDTVQIKEEGIQR